MCREIGLIGINVMPSIQELPTPAAVRCFHHVFKRGGKQAPPLLFSALIASIFRVTRFPPDTLLYSAHLGLIFALLPGWIGVFAAMGNSSRQLISAYDHDTTENVKPTLLAWNRINMVRVVIATFSFGLLVWAKCAAASH